MQMVVIDFVRHGEPDVSIHDDRLRPLTANGQLQAEAVAEKLKQSGYTEIYSSSTRRSLDTVQPLATLLGMRVQVTNELVERRLPGWLPDFSDYVKRQWENMNFTLPGGESIHQVQARYLHFMEGLPGGYIAVGTHGTALSSVYELAYPGQGYEFFRTLPFAAIVRVTMQEGHLVSVQKIT
ncbi:hypothetical protein FC99_GL000629 [Levilactobacillus koreensis JCM 16448]|nr:hypothetical protein FC99_GL000629 [Levilactobacillus koreensis JCM 16448]